MGANITKEEMGMPPASVDALDKIIETANSVRGNIKRWLVSRSKTLSVSAFGSSCCIFSYNTVQWRPPCREPTKTHYAGDAVDSTNLRTSTLNKLEKLFWRLTKILRAYVLALNNREVLIIGFRSVRCYVFLGGKEKADLIFFNDSFFNGHTPLFVFCGWVEMPLR